LIMNDWPACFYTPPQFPTVPPFNVVAEDPYADAVRIGNMINPFNKKEVTIFHGDRCVVINLSGGKNSLVNGPMEIKKSPLGSMGDLPWTSGVDAVFPNPSTSGQDTYFFCGEKYLSFGPPPFMKFGKPAKIIDDWDCLKKAGFTRINAVLQLDGYAKFVWFFSGTKFICAKWSKKDDGSIKSKIHVGPSLISLWAPIQRANFQTVDMILPNPENKNQIWVFSGSKYVLVTFEGGDSARGSIVEGPKLVTQGWPSLASFYA